MITQRQEEILRIKFFQRPQYYPIKAYWEKGDVLCIPLKYPESEKAFDLLKHKLLVLLSKQDNSGQKPYILEK